MARKWMNEGRPTADGRFCLIIDSEDGTQPLRIWGITKDEILDKAAKTLEHGQRTITQLRTRAIPPAHNPATAPQQVQPATTLTAGEQLQLTTDLNNPAKAPAAVTKLVQHHTGLNLEEMARQETIRRIAGIQKEWQEAHPEFPDHPANCKMMTDTAALRVGYENITAAVMESVYNELSAAGMLVPADEEPITDPQPPPTVQPPETADTRTVRTRGAASHRRRDTLPALPASATTFKYTREQIAAMSSAEYRRNLETDPAFAAAVAAYSQPATANA